MNKRNLFLVVLALSGLPMLGACSDDSKQAAATETKVEKTGSAIMHEPLDGSSVSAFEAGVEKVKTEGTPDEYKLLNGAIRRQLAYDLAVQNDKSKLYAKLDGKTPAEVIAKSK